MSVDAIAASQSALQNGGKIVSQSQQGQMNMQDFFKLMAAELQYQDPESATDTSQYVNQMAQFGVLQQITSLSSSFNYAIASGMIDKSVTFSHFDETSGTTQTGSGKVDAVDLSTGTPSCLIGGSWYELSEITGVANSSYLSSLSNSTGAADGATTVQTQNLTQEAEMLAKSMETSSLSAMNNSDSQSLF